MASKNRLSYLKNIWCIGLLPDTFFPPLQVSDPDMHHGTCVAHVPWCMPGSLTIGFLGSRWRGKRSRHMRNPQFYVSGKRPMLCCNNESFLLAIHCQHFWGSNDVMKQMQTHIYSILCHNFFVFVFLLPFYFNDTNNPLLDTLVGYMNRTHNSYIHY